MNFLSKLRLGLAAKVAICAIAGTAAFFALFGFINLRMERSYSRDMVEQSAERITDVILRSTHYQMLHNDRDALLNIIQDLGSEPIKTAASRFRRGPKKSAMWWTKARRAACSAIRGRRHSKSPRAGAAPANSRKTASPCWA